MSHTGISTNSQPTFMSISNPKTLGQFIQAQRALLLPAQAGLPEGTRRRTPGLRREEVAQLCGISVTWYTWIEQGRTDAVSNDVLFRISEVLQLAPAERSHLFELAAGKSMEPDKMTEQLVPQAILKVVRGLKGPAYLLDPLWNVTAANSAARGLFKGWLDRKNADRNLLRFMFCNPAAARLVADWDDGAERMAAEFRADCDNRLDDKDIIRLVDELASHSAAFKNAWRMQEIAERDSGERKFNHPAKGLLVYEQATFRAADRPDLKLVVLT